MNFAKRCLLFANGIALWALPLCASAGIRLTTLHSFNDSDGARPRGALVQAPNGKFYGTAFLGGVNQSGTLFKISPDGSFRCVASFDPALGTEPFSGLVCATNGYFYGTTTMGGPAGMGTVYLATRFGELEILASFAGTNGASPYAALIRGIDGDFYGTTYLGGSSNLGTVFKMSPDGNLTTLVAFSGPDGAHPYASSLIQDGDGTLYGTASTGGTDFTPYYGGAGTVFKITPDGSLTTLHYFDGVNGGSPMAFIRGQNGNFYGTTSYGGVSNWGTVFQLTPAGNYTVLHSFTGNSDGFLPTPAMTLDKNGRIYGATSLGGKFATYDGYGTIFQIDTDGEFSTIYLFGTVTNSYNRPLDGFVPSTLTTARDGSIYGTTVLGGAYNNIGNGGHGTVFRLRRIRPVVTTSQRDYGARSSQKPFTISGSARGIPAVTNVSLSVNQGPWIEATSSNGFRNWSANIIPAPGKNSVRIYAMDFTGDISRTNTVKVFCTQR